MNEREAAALFRPEAMQLLAELSPITDSTDIVKEVSALRKRGIDPEVVAAVLTQRRLRHKARAKFGDFAAHCIFTDAGLQQATRLSVSAHHAGRFAALGAQHVGDLGCGIGADALALAGLGVHVTAIDRDDITAACAEVNLAPFPNATVECTDVTTTDLARFDALWFDPARRSASKRLHDPADWSPSLTWVFDVASRTPSGIKLGPAIDHDLLPDECEAQWVDCDGETVECVVWTGALARPGVARSALVIRGTAAELTAAAPHATVDRGPVGAFVYEPSGAVIRAQLLGTLAESMSAHIIADSIAYLSTDALVRTPFAQAFAVREILPLDIKSIAARLRELSIGVLEVKKRGVDIDPAAFRTALKLKGSNSATLILTRVGDGRAALLVDRV